MGDQYFTPAIMAAQLIAPLRRSEMCVADFASGDGELLRAAAARWPDASIVATDIDLSTVRQINRRHPAWLVGKCDFLSKTSRNRCVALNELAGKVSLALLNPPFSCRGNERYEGLIGSERVLCSRAMAFVLTSLDYLASDGRLAAVLPASSIISEKDAAAWQMIRQYFRVRVRETYDIKTFGQCAARTVVVQVDRAQRPARTEMTPLPRKSRNRMSVRLIRGVTPVYKAVNGLAGSKWGFVHTTNLRNASVTAVNLRVKALGRHVVGPAVLLPRVGQPNSSKCVLYLSRERLVLSDCVYALLCSSRRDAEQLHRLLSERWDHEVVPAYGGTCAQYTTNNRMRHLLRRLGCSVISSDDGLFEGE